MVAFAEKCPFMHTCLGKFPIEFRRGWGTWQHKSVATLVDWASKMDFEFLDLMNVSQAEIQSLTCFGVQVGTIDLLHFGNLLSDDDGVRSATVRANQEMIPEFASAGMQKTPNCVRKVLTSLDSTRTQPLIHCLQRGVTQAKHGDIGCPVAAGQIGNRS